MKQDRFHEAVVNLTQGCVESNVRLGPNLHGNGDYEEILMVEKKTEKTSYTKRLPIKSTPESSTEANIVIRPSTVVVEEGSKMTTVAGRKIKLPQRYRLFLMYNNLYLIVI